LHGRGLEILAVSIDPLGAQVVAPFMQSHRLSFPTLLDPKNSGGASLPDYGCAGEFYCGQAWYSRGKSGGGPRDWAHPQLLAQFERLLAMPATD